MTTTLAIDATLKNRVSIHIGPRVPQNDAEDVINDAWLRILENWEKYDPEINKVVWVWAKYHCKSAVADYYRRRQNHQEYQDGQTAAPPSPSLSDYEQLLEVEPVIPVTPITPIIPVTPVTPVPGCKPWD